MKRSLLLSCSVLALVAVSISGTACHYAAATAGRPKAETQELPGSVKATKAGTGDSRVDPHGSNSGLASAPDKSSNVEAAEGEHGAEAGKEH